MFCGPGLFLLGFTSSLVALWFSSASFVRYVNAFCEVDLEEYFKGKRRGGLVAQDPDGRTVTLTAKHLVMGN